MAVNATKFPSNEEETCSNRNIALPMNANNTMNRTSEQQGNIKENRN